MPIKCNDQLWLTFSLEVFSVEIWRSAIQSNGNGLFFGKLVNKRFYPNFINWKRMKLFVRQTICSPQDFLKQTWNSRAVMLRFVGLSTSHDSSLDCCSWWLLLKRSLPMSEKWIRKSGKTKFGSQIDFLAEREEVWLSLVGQSYSWGCDL